MPYYTMKVVESGRILHAVAQSIDLALQDFGAQLEVNLTLDHSNGPFPYVMDEFTETPHWVNFRIGVCEADDTPTS